jgi:hypothetical protein
MISAALGTAPLMGCAQWRNSDGPRPVPFWNRQDYGRVTSVPAQSDGSKVSDPLLVSNPPSGPGASVAQSIVVDAPTPHMNTQPALPQVDEPGKKPTASKKETFSAITHPAPLDTAPVVMAPAVEAPPLPITVEAPPPGTAKADRVEREAFAIALQCLIDNHPNEALQWLDKYDEPTKEFFLRLLPILKLMTQKSFRESSPDDVAFLGQQVQGLADSLRPLSKLTIEKACFCKRISTYGNYEPLPEDHEFHCAAGNRSGDSVALYVELGNFASVFRNGKYETKLASSIDFLDHDGTWVGSIKSFPEERFPSRSLSLRRDYSNKYTFSVPNSLRAGTYTLVINVRDETLPGEPREASKALEFHLTSVAGGTP